MHVSEITDFQLWDDFVEKSPQGTIFCMSDWLKLYDIPFRIYGYFKNDSLLGGICGFLEPTGDFFDSGFTIPLAPFMGVLVAPQPDAKYTAIMSMHKDITEALLAFLYGEHRFIKIANHYTVPDVRSFTWEEWKPSIRYTYTVDISDKNTAWDNLEKQTRYDITRARRDGQEITMWSLSWFDKLYDQTFQRKGMERPLSTEFLKKLYDTFPSKIVGTAQSMAYSVYDSKRAYYILGASDGTGSALSVWSMLDGLHGMGIKEVDLVGCNDREIANFKSGFGGTLRPYYCVTNI